MRRLLILGSIFVGLLIAVSVMGEGGFQAASPAEATESTITWTFPTSGGITVPAGGPATNFADPAPAACTNCYITSIVPDLVYQSDPDHADGTTANYNNNNSLDGAWLHHTVIVDSCSPGKRVFASGNERTTWSVPTGYGYYQGSCGWLVNYHLHNNGSNTRHVALKLVVTYRTGETLTPVTPIWLDMSNSGNSEYTVSPDYSDTHTGSGVSGISSDWVSTIQGQIVAIGGHVHDYGISVSAYSNRLSDYICTSTAGYGTGSRYLPLTGGGPGTAGHPAAGNPIFLNQSNHEPGGSPSDDKYHIQQMTTCSPTYAQSIICVGDVIRLHSQYNNTSLLPILDAMGIISGEVATNLPDANGNGTIDACDDTDSDGVKNSADNCPMWYNPTQALPSWPVPAGDSECDGFPDTVAASGKAAETSIGTDPTKHCAATGTANDEPTPDANPPDFNDDRIFNGQDTGKYGGPSGAFNHTVAQGPFNGIPGVRFDFNGDGIINGQDTGKFQAYFNKTCA